MARQSGVAFRLESMIHHPVGAADGGCLCGKCGAFKTDKENPRGVVRGFYVC